MYNSKYLNKNRPKLVRVGSRDSQLALVQSNYIIGLLEAENPDIKFEVITMSTIGDKNLEVSLSKIGDKSLFTKELEVALVTKEVDFVVHSMKDMQTSLPPGLVIGSVCNRESLEDAVLMSPAFRGCTLRDLPPGSRVGTSAVRRIAQLKRSYPHLEVVNVRGNLNTRLLKLDDPEEAARKSKTPNAKPITYAALILAKAGVERLGWRDRIDEIINDLYAVGQGALAMECRSDDLSILKLLSSIHDEGSALSCIAERALMHALNGGCSTPVGVRCFTQGDWALSLTSAVYSPDGTQYICREAVCQLATSDSEVKASNDSPVGASGSMGDESTTSKRKISDESETEPLTKKSKKSFKLMDPVMGVTVYPICDIGRYRMQQAYQLGCTVAADLCQQGADKILAAIKKCVPSQPPQASSIQPATSIDS